jgi:hypothetical protein
MSELNALLLIVLIMVGFPAIGIYGVRFGCKICAGFVPSIKETAIAIGLFCLAYIPLSIINSVPAIKTNWTAQLLLFVAGLSLSAFILGARLKPQDGCSIGFKKGILVSLVWSGFGIVVFAVGTADSSAQAVRPCPPMTHWRKHHARLSVAQRCASASPWACRLPGSLSRLPTQAAAGSCPPAASLDHHPFPAGTDRPACDSADRRRLNRRTGSPRAARILAPGKGTTPAVRPNCSPSIPAVPGIPSVATRRHCFGFGS